MNAGNSAGINQNGVSAFNIFKGHYLGDMAVSAADKIVISCAGHAVAIMWIVSDKNAPSAEFKGGIHAVVYKMAVGFCHEILDGHRVAEIVAVYHMYRQAKLEGCAQGVSTYHITAMDDCLRPGCMCRSNSSSKRFGTIVTVGDDADFQFYLPF